MTDLPEPELPNGCLDIDEVAAELALGVLPAEERATALVHLEHCPDCRAQLRQFTLVADQLLDLVPEVQPPAGFEERLLSRMSPGSAGSAIRPLPATGPPATELSDAGVVSLPSRRALRGRAGRRLQYLLPAVAATIALVFGLGGWLAGVGSQQPDGRLLSAQLITADHREVGQVYAQDGSHGWMSMNVDTDGPTETVICQLRRSDGSTVEFGKFKLADGYGYWGTPVEPGATPVSAQLLRADGSVLATATFTVT